MTQHFVLTYDIREVFKKKNGYKAVRLTAWVEKYRYPPLPRSGQEKVNKF